MAAIRTFLAALTLRDVPKMRSGRVSPENPTAACQSAPGSWPSAFMTDYDNYILLGEFSCRCFPPLWSVEEPDAPDELRRVEPSLYRKRFRAGAFSPRVGQTMDLILVKFFATALALSEVMTQPQAVKTHFDAVADTAQRD